MSDRKRYQTDKEVQGYDENQNYSRQQRNHFRGNDSPSMSPPPHHAAATGGAKSRVMRRSRSRSYERDAKNDKTQTRNHKYENQPRDAGRNKFAERPPREHNNSGTVRPAKKSGFHDTYFEENFNQQDA